NRPLNLGLKRWAARRINMLGAATASRAMGQFANSPARSYSANGQDGVLLASTNPPTANNLVEGNRIGTDISGTMALVNSANGVLIAQGAASNTIGGSVMGTNNVISGNGNDGVLLTGSMTMGNVVEGNQIGTDINGTMALGNSVNGVEISSAASSN